MKRERIKTVLTQGRPDSEVTVCGWVRTKREGKGFAFVVINDGSTQDNLQLVIDHSSPAFKELSRCNTGAALRVTGILKQSQGQGQSLEVQAKAIAVVGEADPETFPLQKKGHSLEFLREISHLRPRTNTFGAIFRVRNAVAFAVHEFFQKRGFVWLHTPIISASDCEGAGALFQVTTLDLAEVPRVAGGKIDFSKDFFGKQAFLTVSGQLEGELVATALSDIYTFGPTFRAENSNTTRHLSEFWMIEPEVAWADLADDMQLAEDMFRCLCRAVVERCPAELAFLEKQYQGVKVADIAKLAESKFDRMSYTEAIKELEKAPVKFEFPVKWGIDMQSEHEKYLTDVVFKGPVIVHDYPEGIKSFYMRQNDDGKTVAAMDVLAPGVGEIMGGSQREERLDKLETRMRHMNIPADHMQWYLDTRRFGSVPHAGYGLGFERFIMYVTGMGNIRDVIGFPRAPKTL